MAVRAAEPSPLSLSMAGPAAEAAARICTVAGKLQRRMRLWAAEFPAPYDPDSFDPGLYSMLALAAAFSEPRRTVDELQPAGRVRLWTLGLARCAARAASESEVRRIAEHCAAVADGAAPAPGDDLARFLAAIRDELSELPTYPVLHEVWRDELRRTLQALSRNRAALGRRPTFEEYLDNADCLGLALTFTAHRIAIGDTGPGEEPTDAARAVQRAVRLSGDLGAAARRVDPGEPNALTLGLPRPALELRLAELTGQARRLIAAARVRHPEQADHLERHMDFYAGFFGTTDH
ncbi:hypothetical protein SAMN04489712_102352 [Thermomonospora echinospora]|uniref:Terpene synthase family, metal binding domain n=1 Tax=Thermomonospora echinospora TaxID=1992 RepID=A0A1H5VK78_9ACTN|nr:hypothetical protein [Thermomonospora echinospora]SEF87679.1 hypothetical protein SAMN04489712_102352 [Thermomonospora echinospora]